MKIYKYLFLLILFSSLFFTSCSVQKRTHRSGYHVEWIKTKKASPIDNQVSEKSLFEDEGLEKIIPVKEDSQLPNEEVYFAYSSTSLIHTKSIENKFFEECDNIILTNGEEIKAKVLEISIDLIKYKKCDNPEGPIYSIAKSDVFMIKYINGTKDIFTTPETVKTQNNKNKSSPDSRKKPSTEPIGVVSMLLGITAWLVPTASAAIIICAAAVLVGVVSLDTIKKKPERYNGRGFAIVGITLGLLGLIIIIAADLDIFK